MLYKLEANAQPMVMPLFAGLAEAQPMCACVLDGIYPGRIYVDDSSRPRNAYLQTSLGGEEEPQWGFLAGDPLNAPFNAALNQALLNREIIHANAPLVFFTCIPTDWGGELGQVFAPHQPVPAPRRHYLARTFRQDRQPAVPAGFSLERMDQSLLDRPGLNVPGEVQQTLGKWRRIREPRFADYGFIAIDTTSKPQQVAAWATVDFVARGMGDLGMFTLEGYRRRGLAHLVTAAAISHGLSCGLKQICWTCMEDNPGSIRTAEKLGLVRGQDYTMYCLFFDSLQEQAALAYDHLVSKRYREAADLLEGLIKQGNKLPNFVFYDAACAWAELGDEGKALFFLNSLAEKGWTDLASIKDSPRFRHLHDAPEWDRVLLKLRENQANS